MASEVEIASMALNKLGAQRITAFDDGTNRSNLCRDFYPSVRDATLRAYPWNCSINQKLLAAEVAAPLFGYSYKFQLPVLPYCLRVLKIENEPDYNIKGTARHEYCAARLPRTCPCCSSRQSSHRAPDTVAAGPARRAIDRYGAAAD